jgi:uncharacterized membrane protein
MYILISLQIHFTFSTLKSKSKHHNPTLPSQKHQYGLLELVPYIILTTQLVHSFFISHCH